MSTRVSRKRARTEPEEIPKEDPEVVSRSQTSDLDLQPHYGDEHGNGELERDAEFWIRDGTVNVVAQNVEFRFYRAFLADHFPVFKTRLFATGQHPTRRVPIDEQQYITCPVVQLTDSPQDLRYILRAYIWGTQPG